MPACITIVILTVHVISGKGEQSTGMVGKTTESVHPQNFQYGLVIWHTKKGRKNFWGLACGKRDIALFGVKSIECCKKRLNDVIVFCASLLSITTFSVIHRGYLQPH